MFIWKRKNIGGKVEGIVDDVRGTFMVILDPTTILAPANEDIELTLVLRHYFRSVLEDQG